MKWGLPLVRHWALCVPFHTEISWKQLFRLSSFCRGEDWGLPKATHLGMVELGLECRSVWCHTRNHKFVFSPALSLSLSLSLSHTHTHTHTHTHWHNHTPTLRKQDLRVWCVCGWIEALFQLCCSFYWILWFANIKDSLKHSLKQIVVDSWERTAADRKMWPDAPGAGGRDVQWGGCEQRKQW